MPFDNLPPQSKINPKADAYTEDALRLSREAATHTRNVRDVIYGEGYWQSLDIYLPEDPNLRDLPVLMFAHGGGWTHGYKEWCGFNAPALVDLPAIFVSINYRLAPEHRLPAAHEDGAAALAWLTHNIARHGGDPNRIHVGGHSAGAHLAAMLTLNRDFIARRGLPVDVIKACFPVSGTYDFNFPDVQPGTGEWRLHNLALRSTADIAALSPINHVEGNTTPFFLCWGGEDLDRTRRSNPEMLRALREQPSHAGHHVFKDFDHFQIHLDQRRPENLWVRTVRHWMQHGPA
jgi:arylformamidase